MNSPDCRVQDFNPEILTETTGDGRLVAWIPVGMEGSRRRWERVGSVARAEVGSNNGVCFTAATMVPSRERSSGILGGLLRRIRGTSQDKLLALPNGRLVEPCDKRRTDVVLAWATDPMSPIDEAQVRARWPGCESIRKLGENLYAVVGVGAEGTLEGGDLRSPTPAGSGDTRRAPDPVTAGSSGGTRRAPDAVAAPLAPKDLAERALAEAIEAHDRQAEAVALSDLGFIALNDGNVTAAVPSLEKALVLAREAGDQVRVAELLGHLGFAFSAIGHHARAIELIEQGIAAARSVRDPFAEKMLFERRGQVETSLKRAEPAIASYEQALRLAREVGDHHQEGFLLWKIGALHAELGDRERAIARCVEAIGLFRDLGKPHAAWFAQHLDRYRSEMSVGIAVPAGAHFGTGRGGLPSQAANPNPSGGGPGILQMAVSASKAMAKFVGSGMKTVSPEIQDWRLSTCRGCEHHTGIRCRVCGCFTDVKTRLGGESCPIGKW